MAQAVPSTCAGTSTTTPLGRCTPNAAVPGVMRTGTNVGAVGAGSVRTPRLLSVECAVYSPLTDRPWAFAHPLSVCPCSRHTRRWSSQNCWRSVRRAFERGIACTIADTLHGILDGSPWHGRRPYGTTHFTRRLREKHRTGGGHDVPPRNAAQFKDDYADIGIIIWNARYARFLSANATGCSPRARSARNGSASSRVCW